MQNPRVIQIPHGHLTGGGADMRSRLVTWEWRRPTRHLTSQNVETIYGVRLTEPAEPRMSGRRLWKTRIQPGRRRCL